MRVSHIRIAQLANRKTTTTATQNTKTHTRVCDAEVSGGVPVRQRRAFRALRSALAVGWPPQWRCGPALMRARRAAAATSPGTGTGGPFRRAAAELCVMRGDVM